MTGPILVTGGTGTVGRPVVDGLVAAGHQVRVASRRERRDHESAHEWAQVDYGSGAGWDRALDGVGTVVHCANSLRGARTMDRRVVDRAVRAHVDHFVYISIVGIDRIPFGYYRAKLATEQQLESCGMPYSILRATQFHDLAYMIVAALSAPWVAPMPAGWRLQPVAAREVAERLVALAGGPPAGRVPDFGGPQVRLLSDLAARYRESIGRRPRPVLPIPVPGAVSAALRDGANLTPEHADGHGTFEQYLAERAGNSR